MNQTNRDGSTTEVGWRVTGKLRPVDNAHHARLMKARLSLHVERRTAEVSYDLDTVRALLNTDLLVNS